MEQRMLRPAAPSTSFPRPLAGRPHPAEPGRGAAAGPTLRPARGVVEATQPLRPASSVAEAARRRLPVHRPQGSLPRLDQEDCGGMFLIRNPRRFPSVCYLLVLTLALLVVSTAAPSQYVSPPGLTSLLRPPLLVSIHLIALTELRAQDNEIRQKKEACYTDVEKYVLGG